MAFKQEDMTQEFYDKMEYALCYFGYFEPIIYKLIPNDEQVEIINPTMKFKRTTLPTLYDVAIDLEKVNLGYEDIRKLVTYINPLRWEVNEWYYDEEYWFYDE